MMLGTYVIFLRNILCLRRCCKYSMYPDICLKSFKHLYSWLKISVAELDILRLRNIDYIGLWLI